MLQYIIRRLLLMIPTLIGVSLLTFCLVKLAPGSPEKIKFSGGAAAGQGSVAGGSMEKQIERWRKKNLFDRNVFVQYLQYVGPFNLNDEGHEWFGGTGDDPWGGLLAFDMGEEFLKPGVRVFPELIERLKVTVPLAAISILISYLLALPLGIFAAVRQGTPVEVGSTVSLFLLYAVPTFWAGLMLQLMFGKTGLDLLPVLGLHDKDAANLGTWDYFVDTLKHSILPIATYSYGSLAYLSRQMRVGVIDAITQDYVRTARAKGLNERVVIFKHVLRNSVIPIVTLLASILPILIGGSIIVEFVFDIHGMGGYAYHGLVNREYNIIMATTIFVAFMTMVGILISDITYAIVDPRIRYA